MRSKSRLIITTVSYIFFYCWILSGCKSYEEQKKELPDTPLRGTIHVSADESFKPVINEQVKVYESNNPGTKIIVDYKPEAECLKDLLTDSVRMIIITRGVSEEERDAVIDSLRVGPRSLVIARDGISVIVNPAEMDSLMTMNDIREILTGKVKNHLIPVFDGLKATSTVRFIIDSVLRGDTLTSKALAARNTESMIKRTVLVAFSPSNTGIKFFLNLPVRISRMSFILKSESGALGFTITATPSLATTMLLGDTFIESIIKLLSSAL